MLDEPVRGSIPEPGFFSLSGLEQMRASIRGLVPTVPIIRLMGGRVTEVSSGTSVLIQPLSPWFETQAGFVELTHVAETNIFITALTGAPPGSYVRPVNLSLRYLRACRVADESVIARGRVLHAGSNFTTVETLIEDALGRAVAHATGSVVIEPLDPPPPPLSRPLQPVEEPVYPGPDPPRRRVPPRPTLEGSEGRFVPPAIAEFLGVEFLEMADGRATAIMPNSEWFCRMYREVSPGVQAIFGSLTGGAAIGSVISADEHFLVINSTNTFMAPVLPDGRRLTATGVVRRQSNDVMVVDVEITGAGGETVVVGHSSTLVGRPPARSAPIDRELLSVLFTDLVGSTERARQLGDRRWQELLQEHNAVVRRQLQIHKGHEVKTTGDGFLATFDSPTRAVQCARAVRDTLTRLGLQIRSGIHTGECEISRGDVSGLAVHVASRVQSVAGPGEILVSATVRDLVAGSGLSLSDRGVHDLKGLEGKWQLYALEE